MRVCDLTYAYNEVSGGIRTYIDAKRAYLRERTDWHHLLVIPGAEDGFEQEGRLAVCRVASPVLPGSAPYRLILRPDKVLAALRRFRPDVIELGSLYTLPWMAFRYRRERPDCACVGFYHTDLPSAYVQPVAAKLLGDYAGAQAYRLAAAYTRALYRRCDAVVTASPALREKLDALSVPGAHVIPLGVDLDTFHPARRSADVRARFGADKRSLLLIYAGRFDVEKRALLLVDAFKKLPPSLEARLLLVGQGPLQSRLEAAAASTERLFVLPFQQDKAELARLLASSDVYLAANPHETFGLSVVEAQACGLPVVGVRAGALIERVPPSVGVLVAPDDAGAMARAITSLAAEDRKALGARARSLVEAHFGWDATFEQLFELYEAAREQAKASFSPNRAPGT